MNERSREDYRGTSLIARTYRKTVRGKAWLNGREIASIEGVSEPDVLASLRALVDAAIVVEDDASEVPYPDPETYTRALQASVERLSETQRAMLRTHYRAARRTVTATELAAAAGYRTWTTAHQQYARIGRTLGQAMLFEPRSRSGGVPAWVLVLADSADADKPDSRRRWRMRDQLADALKAAGIV